MSALEKLSKRLDLTETDDLTRNRRLLNMAQVAVERANSMTALVRNYSRLEAEKKSDNVLICSVIKDVIDDNNVRIKGDSVKVKINCDNGITVKANRIHLYSLINNLLLNSLDAVSESNQKQINIEVNAGNGRQKIVFNDSGCGIENENLSKIYNTFFSTKPNSGTGLGLSMVKKIVDLYDGQIDVKSELYKGTTFTIEFSTFSERGTD
jgi:signal transduction histidine kinase